MWYLHYLYNVFDACNKHVLVQISKTSSILIPVPTNMLCSSGMCVLKYQ